MKKLTLDDVTWIVLVEQDHAPVRGNALASGDDAADKRAEDSIIRRLNAGNVWAWASVRVIGRWCGLQGTESLGCCSYRNEADFRKNSGYFDDMRNEVLGQLQEEAEKIAADMTGLPV